MKPIKNELMRKMFKSKKLLSAVLSVFLVFSSASVVFAAWPSFQNDLDNNGVLSGTPLTTQAGTGVTLSSGTYLTQTTFNKAGSSFLGTVNNTAVIDDGYAYYLYNGAGSSGSYYGGRIAKYNLSTGAEVWNKQTTTSAFAQLSTPALVGDTLYFLSTGSAPAFTNAPAVVNIPANSYSTVINNVTLAGTSSARLFVQAAIDAASSSTNISLSVRVTKPDSSTVDLNMDNNSATETGAPTTMALSTTSSSLNKNYATVFATAGTYTIEFKYTNNDGSNAGIVNVSDCQLFENSFQLKKIADVTAANPSVESVYSFTASGQANTPISYDGTYLYFGRWTSENGAGSYYQYKISDGTLKTYNTNRGYYWVGATVVGGNVYFGCDDGYLHYRSVSAFDTTGGTIAASGNYTIRSSVVHYYNENTEQDELYFSAKNGYLYRYNIATATMSSMDIDTGSSAQSTSTPVISPNGVIYVGANNGFNAGSVIAVPVTSFGSYTNVYTSGPVQSSPIVKSTTYYDEVLEQNVPIDYVYFTTNASSARGYCYSFVPSTSAVGYTWQTPAGYYALGGISGDGSYLTFGDNGGNLFIIKNP